MFRTKSAPAFLGLLLVMTSHCGTGGIVDNGEKPKDDPAPEDRASSAPLKVEPLTVLGLYTVTPPDGTWSSTSSESSTTVKNNLRSIVFSYVPSACDAVPVKNSHAVELYTCSPTHTILLVPGGRFIEAFYTDLDTNTDAILKSFAPK